MEVTQTLTEGLKQEFKVVLASADLAARLDSKLEEFRSKAHLKGFRPGKAPVSHLKKIYGREIMGEIVETAVNDANRKIIEDNNLRLATQPKLDFPGGQEEVEKILSAAGDLAYVVSFETLPKIELGSFDDIAIERPVSDVTDEDVDKAIRDLVERLRDYDPAEEGYKAATGDRVTIDFAGKIDGEPFEGGSGEDLQVVLGSNTFIPGFEDQLVGAAVGEQRIVTARFPENYSVKHLAGREAVFDTTVKAIEKPKPLEIDDELAKKWNFDTLEAFKTAVRANVEADFDKASRDKVKRALLDALDARYKFEVPESLTSMEFDGIWREFEIERKAPGAEPETKSEDELRAEYRTIAERRVRLGLLLAEIGQAAGVTVEDKDLTQALVERARQFPGQEKAVWDYYRNNEQALSTLRAPIYEEHVVRHLSGIVRMAAKKVSREELFADEEDAKPAA